MAELDTVIKALEFCNSSEDCRGCVYFTDALKGKCKCGADALELLKEYKQLRLWAWHAVKEQDVKLE